MEVDLAINTEVAEQILTKFIKSEVQRANFSKVVVGLSGGLDSAVSCVLAVKALGEENVIAIRMPYKSSSPDSLKHAKLVIDKFNIPNETIEITDIVDAFGKRDPEITKMRMGNIMARVRMILLYDQSESKSGLVLGTSNKTEILLGYSTLWGDMASALNPIGDLYKTQVRQLARFLGVPQEIIDKPPSADLWQGQTDEMDLGFSYENVDRLMYLLVDHRYNFDECVTEGFDPAFVQTVLDRIRKNQFKRVMPPIAKLSNRTVGYDFLYLRDWGT